MSVVPPPVADAPAPARRRVEPAFEGTPVTHDEWVSRAREVARLLSADAVERDRSDREPVEEVALLRSAGLPAALVPARFGGGGVSWETALAIVREVAKADGSIGQLIGYNYANLSKVVLTGTAEQQQRLFTASAENQWFWGGSVNPIGPSVTFVPTAQGYRARGRRTFATGSSVADVIIVSGTLEGSEGTAVAVVRPDPARVVFGEDWDNLGMRLTASGSVTFDDAWVDGEDMLSPLDGRAPTARHTLTTPVIQAVFGHLYLGIAEGALQAAAAYTRTTSRPWLLSDVTEATSDPYVLETYGILSARTQAVGAFADLVARRLDEVARAEADVTWEVRGDLAARVAALKVLSTDLVLDVTNRVFEVTGARATSNAFGFDRFWRNARTHTLHDPVSYKRREVGDYYLHGRRAEFSLYT